MLAINPNDPSGPAGLPVSITDTDTGRVVGRFKALIDAHKARAVLEGDMVDRAAACPCCDGPCDCGADCMGCDCMRARKVADAAPVAFSTSKTVAW